VSIMVSVGQADAAFQWWRGRTGADGRPNLGCGLSFGSPSLRQWLLDLEAGGRLGSGFGGCQIPSSLGQALFRSFSRQI
jgi:hypothetical protein